MKLYLCWRSLELIKGTFKIPSRLISYKIKMLNIAYFRHVDTSNECSITFRLNDPNLSVDKQFNFCRKLTETAGSFLSRLQGNLDKAIMKKASRKKKKADDTSLLNTNVTVSLLRDGYPVEQDFPLSSVFTENDKFALKISDVELPVEINSPWIEQLSLPKFAMAGFPVYPNKCEGYFFEIENSNFEWSKASATNRNKWEPIAKGFHYNLKPADVGFYLKLVCEPGNSSVKGPSVEAVSDNPVGASPGRCPFDTRHNFTKDIINDPGVFRVLSYNILADLYATTEESKTVLFTYCPQYALEMVYRKQLILKEITGYNSDIICLQEVDRSVYTRDLSPILKANGFEGRFAQKGPLAEGCATFFRSERFEILWDRRIVLSEEIETNSLFSGIWEKIKLNEPLKKRFLNLYTSLQIIALKSRTWSNRILLVANTHFYFHPDADHVRLLQGGLGAIYVNAVSRELETENPGCNVSVIWCGDFNSVPECGIYQLLTTGFVGEDFVDWKSNEDEAVVGVNLTSDKVYQSACGTPMYTNFTHLFQACLDYIYIERNKFEVVQIIPLPSYEELTAHVAIPSVVAPSDHIALVVDLKYI